jgi:hypothetical protein
MDLVSGKIYRVLPYVQAQTLPVLQINGSATIYVSVAQTEPTSVSEMVDVTNEVEAGFNTLFGQIRYICAVFSSGSSVSEAGIVSQQNKTDRL